jgi:hypothetical protein
MPPKRHDYYTDEYKGDLGEYSKYTLAKQSQAFQPSKEKGRSRKKLYDDTKIDEDVIETILSTRHHFRFIPELTSIISAKSYLAEHGYPLSRFDIRFSEVDFDDNPDTPPDLKIFDKKENRLFSLGGYKTIKFNEIDEVVKEKLMREYYDKYPFRDERATNKYSEFRRDKLGLPPASASSMIVKLINQHFTTIIQQRYLATLKGNYIKAGVLINGKLLTSKEEMKLRQAIIRIFKNIVIIPYVILLMKQGWKRSVKGTDIEILKNTEIATEIDKILPFHRKTVENSFWLIHQDFTTEKEKQGKKEFKEYLEAKRYFVKEGYMKVLMGNCSKFYEYLVLSNNDNPITNFITFDIKWILNYWVSGNEDTTFTLENGNRYIENLFSSVYVDKFDNILNEIPNTEQEEKIMEREGGRKTKTQIKTETRKQYIQHQKAQLREYLKGIAIGPEASIYSMYPPEEEGYEEVEKEKEKEDVDKLEEAGKTGYELSAIRAKKMRNKQKEDIRTKHRETLTKFFNEEEKASAIRRTLKMKGITININIRDLQNLAKVIGAKSSVNKDIVVSNILEKADFNVSEIKSGKQIKEFLEQLLEDNEALITQLVAEKATKEGKKKAKKKLYVDGDDGEGEGGADAEEVNGVEEEKEA